MVIQMRRVKKDWNDGSKVKIRMPALTKVPIELTIYPGVKAIFDENKIAVVSNSLAKVLTGPEYSGYEIVEEIEKEVKPEAKAQEAELPAQRQRRTKPEIPDEQAKKIEDFTKQM